MITPERMKELRSYFSEYCGVWRGMVDAETGIKLLDALYQCKEALEQIVSHENMTMLADCCVEKSCHINKESGSCSFQTGVHYGYSNIAGKARETFAQVFGVEK